MEFWLLNCSEVGCVILELEGELSSASDGLFAVRERLRLPSLLLGFGQLH